MSAFQAAFGNQLVLSDKTVVDTETHLANVENVCIYFSAHWCPPCRGFTPQLSEWYKEYKAKNPKMEIVFASSDKDQDNFDDYHSEMPWPAVPFSERTVKDKLSNKFKVRGIPTLVVIDKEGNTITTDGRSKVSEDPEGAEFPWVPPTFADALGTEFVNNKGDTTTLDDLQGKVLALYFSAHWCPPCKGFTPKLVETYNKVVAAGKELEVIFVSSDRSESEYNDYFAEMPWLSVPLADKTRKNNLSTHFNVEGIPTLVFVHPDGTVINSDGRSAISSDPEGNDFPWHPKPINSIESPSGINETPSVVVMMEKVAKSEQETILAALTSVATPYLDKSKKTGEEAEMLFFYGTEESGIGSRIRSLVGGGDATDKAQVFLIDIPDSGAYFDHAGEPTEEGLAQFLELYHKRETAPDKDAVLKRNQLNN